jgi:hypothetical protein
MLRRPVLLALLALACARTGEIEIRLHREGGLTFETLNGFDTYEVNLTQAKLVVDSVNLVAESDPFSTRLFTGPVVFDFAAEEDLTLVRTVFRPKGFDQIHVFFDNPLVGEMAGLTLSLDGTVTRTDGTTVPLAIRFAIDERSPQEILAAVTIPIRDREEVELILNPAVLLDKINFDALSTEGAVSLSTSEESPETNSALRILEENLLVSLRFDGPAGSADQ